MIRNLQIPAFYLLVFSKDITEPILLAVASLELAIHEEPNTAVIATVNIVPQSKIFYATRISLLWRILSNKSNLAAVKHQVCFITITNLLNA